LLVDDNSANLLVLSSYWKYYNIYHDKAFNGKIAI